MDKTIFCANCQAEQEQTLEQHGMELVATCPVCGRAIKFPAGLKKAKLDSLIADHKEANEGHQVIPSMVQ